MSEAPLIVTCEADNSSATAETLLRLAGWTIVNGWALPREPWDLHDKTVFAGSVDSDETAACAVEAAVRGSGVVAEIAPGWSGRTRLVAALRREGTPVVWDQNPPPIATLRADDVRLLYLLGAGKTVGEAGRDIHLSERSAHRRAALCREVLGVSSNTEAAVAVASLVDQWRAA